MINPVNLLDFDRQSLAAYFVEQGEKPFRAAQVIQWVHHFGVTSFDEMTNIGKTLCQKLKQNTVIKLPQILTEHLSADGTRKWVLKLHDNNCIETVYIPEADRGTLCISSQAGCALNCSFCATGKQGFNRNLSVAEITGQIWIAARCLSRQGAIHDRQITNVVMMGMGEPLLNFDNVVKAMKVMRDDYGYGLSKRRVTLSTAGIVPAMKKLSEASDVSLAVSLHAPTDELRNLLVPINKKYPLSELIPACKSYFKEDSRRRITFEYVMLDNVNDSKEHAYQLLELLKDVPAKLNLIPFNPISLAPYRCSPPAVIDTFRNILKDKIVTVTRKTRGRDIKAACGQLAGHIQDRTRRTQQYAAIRKGDLHEADIHSTDATE